MNYSIIFTRDYLFNATMMLVLLGFCVTSGKAQITAFTYQGKLTDNMAAASGAYQMQFAVWDSQSGGTQISTTWTNTNVIVTNGIFTSQMDFGETPFDGSIRYLEISVRKTSSDPYMPLFPRQRITSSPYAIKALKATTADDVSPGSTNYIQNTSTQQASSNFNISGTGAASVFDAGTQYSIGGSPMLSAPGSNTLILGSVSGVNGATANANVGIGTTAPRTNLDVRGDIFVGPQALAVPPHQNSLFISNDGGDINNTFRLDGASNNLYFVANSGTGAATGAGFIFRTSTAAGGENDQVTIKGDGTLTTRGRLGIGTANPNAMLSVAGNGELVGSAASAALRTTAPSNLGIVNGNELSLASIGFINDYFNANSVSLGIRAMRAPFTCCGPANSWTQTAIALGLDVDNTVRGTSGTAIWIHANGNVGIGPPVDPYFAPAGPNKPTYKLFILDPTNKGLRVETQTTGGAVASFGGYGDFQIDGSGVAGGRFTVTEGGNVGIGTASPAYKLDVNGTIRGTNVSPSDLRFKQNISPLDSSLQKVMQLRGVSYDWRRGEFPSMNFSAGRQVGFIAQEVEKVLPEVVSRDNEGYRSIAYSEILPIVVEAVKEQQAQIERQDKRIAAQQSEINELRILVCRRNRRAAVCK